METRKDWATRVNHVWRDGVWVPGKVDGDEAALIPSWARAGLCFIAGTPFGALAARWAIESWVLR